MILETNMTEDKKTNLTFQTLSKRDKSLLKNRIFSSIYSCKRRKRIFRNTFAASVAIIIAIVTISMYNGDDKIPSIEKFAQTQSNRFNDQNVQLILSETEKVDITDADANITYSNSGEEVCIGTSGRVDQKVASSKGTVYNTLIIPYGKRSEIVLADGSKVWLNSGSKLVFPAKFALEKREVYLEGEAIFEVIHNKSKPFFVKSQNHEIKVLGTVFNVSNYDDDKAIYTVLKSGSVQINYTVNSIFNAEKNIRIKPGMMCTFDKTKRSTKETNVNVERYFSWRDGVFIFKNDSLKSIMKKISRYYNVEIVIANTARAKETFSGYLDVRDNIKSVLQIIKEAGPKGFEFKFSTDDKIIIN
jgi:hypothetical protein